MIGQQIDLAILPTAGVIRIKETKQWVPTPHGKMRCDKLIDTWRKGDIKAIAIIGGRRIGMPSEAWIYSHYMRVNCPNIPVVFVGDRETCTNRDLPAAKLGIEAYLRHIGRSKEDCVVASVSYEEHLDRIEIILKHLGFLNIERVLSGESRCYSPITEKALTVITKCDPEWTSLPGLLLVLLANRRIHQAQKE